MREYTDQNILKSIKCNKCGKNIKFDNTLPEEDYISVSKNWGYFSSKDGEKHEFDLCEECYDNLTGTFEIPVSVMDNNELI
ncbi:MAG: hypothetical protein IIT48_09405 [Lachnospiraceae bacterium]|nr:hypothetical protein [Lachnospiraceae bacterium]